MIFLVHINLQKMKKLDVKTLIIAVLILMLIGVSYYYSQAPKTVNLDEMEADVSDEVVEEEVAAPVVTTPTPTPAPVAITPTKVYKSCTPDFSAEKSKVLRGIILRWDTCPDEDFQLYKLVRSNIDPIPSYLENNVIYSSSNKDAGSYVDSNLVSGTDYYYRICAFKRLEKPSCSAVAMKTF